MVIALTGMVTSIFGGIAAVIAALNSRAAVARSENNGVAIIGVKETIAGVSKTVQTLETNTNSIKDALIRTTATEAHARGVSDERERQTAVEGAKAVAIMAERDRIEAAPKPK